MTSLQIDDITWFTSSREEGEFLIILVLKIHTHAHTHTARISRLAAIYQYKQKDKSHPLLKFTILADTFHIYGKKRKQNDTRQLIRKLNFFFLKEG